MVASIEARLRALTDQHEVRETLLRYCRAVDRGDRDLLEVTLAPGALIDTSGTAIGVDELVRRLEAVGECATLSHFVGNDLIELDGDRAAGEAYVLAIRVAADPDTGEQTMRVRGGRYVVRFARGEDDGWRIALLTLVDDWSRVDAIARTADGVPAHRGSRTRADPSYRGLAADPDLPGGAMTNERLVRTYVEGIGTCDIETVASTLADDFVYEHALTADGVASRVDGRQAFVEYLAGFVAPGSGFFDAWEFYDVVVYPGHDGRVFAEWKSRATVAATGKPYANSYIGVFEVHDGRIALLREYRDPNRVKEAMGS